MTRGEVAGALIGVSAVAGANWVIEQGYLPLVLVAAAVCVVAFLIVFGPRERGQTTTSPGPVGGRPRSGSPGRGPDVTRSSRRDRARMHAARRRLPTL